MKSAPQTLKARRDAVDECLALLRDRFGDTVPVDHAGSPPLRALLSQDRQPAAPAPIRAVYHAACTGGTLICKCLSAMPNSVVLSEIDPLSTLHLQDRTARFLPTDILAGLHYSLQNVGSDTLVRVFQSGLDQLLKELTARGQDLVVRGHSHSQYFTHAPIDGRPTLHEILGAVAPTRALVTLRHPLDSFLSQQDNGWDSFEPFTLEEYARRYMVFLDAHETLPSYKYETFLESPEASLQKICGFLDLPYWPGFEDALPLMNLSGDSGRKGSSIGPRPRREVPDEVAQDRQSPSYRNLCARLDYEP